MSSSEMGSGAGAGDPLGPEGGTLSATTPPDPLALADVPVVDAVTVAEATGVLPVSVTAGPAAGVVSAGADGDALAVAPPDDADDPPPLVLPEEA
jgi:hypothetical protein